MIVLTDAQQAEIETLRRRRDDLLRESGHLDAAANELAEFEEQRDTLQSEIDDLETAVTGKRDSVRTRAGEVRNEGRNRNGGR